VIKFLNNPENRKKVKAVIAGGNTNFGSHFCKAGEIVADKLGVPMLYRFEVTGTPEDVSEVNERLERLWRTR
jgi:protein involved in ribonucleotide reduction